MASDLSSLDVDTTNETRRFWQELAHGRITLPWCAVCDTHVWFPKALCTVCLTPVTEERTLPGTGEVYTYSIVHRGTPAFRGAEPYVLAYVVLDGGPTVLSNIVGEDALEVAIGDRVRIATPTESVEYGALRFVREVA